ncbi:class I SAM-dependent methyltransferase [Viridibacterium curvum]|uniref:Methyltransferase type 11 domain-containing protein n=1 Tax=Viridibacterium curvum TaxID=1101404 RepID=A0ABP9QUM6_9RHOO
MRNPRDAAARNIVEDNRRFYESLWSGARLVRPQRFNTWPLVSRLLAPQQCRVEVAPGLRPRLPLEDTLFIDISHAALASLKAVGARVAQGQIGSLPLASGSADFLCAFDVIEHVEDEDGSLAELARVTRPGAVMLASVPLHPERWNAFDEFVGHHRRYEPERLLAKLDEHGFVVEQSAIYGLQAKSSRVLEAGMWWLTHQRERAMWWYNLFMPLSLSRQPKLVLEPGMIDGVGVDEVLLVCRRRAAATHGNTP